MKGKLILFPVAIGAAVPDQTLPPYNRVLLDTCNHFIVEELRSARRFLKWVGYSHPLEEVTFNILNEHTQPEEVENLLQPATQGFNVGMLSEAGLPCVADPGRLITSLAHRRGIEIVPLVGPSSLMLALMASGLNGQSFAFVGYLPVGSAERAAAIRQLETRTTKEHQTQIFIEAPYRNNQLLKTLCETCRPTTFITVACDLTMPTQTILTFTASQWKNKYQQINLHKRNTVFLIGCEESSQIKNKRR